MKTLLVGAGSVGGITAVFMKHGGFDIDIMEINSERAEDIRTNGIFITGAKGDANGKFNAYCSVDELPCKYDICIIATKSMHLEAAAKSILPVLNDDALVVSMQNGICVEKLVPIVGESRAVGVMIGFGATMTSPEHITMTSKGRFYIGMADGSHPEKLDYLAKMYNAVLPTKITTDIRSRLWSKLIINSCINSVAAITGETLGVILDVKAARILFLEIAREAMRVAKGLNIDVPTYGVMLNYKMLMVSESTFYNFCCRLIIRVVGKLGFGKVKPSTLQSLERGEKTEIDIFNGYISKKGSECGVLTPVNTKLTEMIYEIEQGKRKITQDNLKEFEKN